MPKMGAFNRRMRARLSKDMECEFCGREVEFIRGELSGHRCKCPDCGEEVPNDLAAHKCPQPVHAPIRGNQGPLFRSVTP